MMILLNYIVKMTNLEKILKIVLVEQNIMIQIDIIIKEVERYRRDPRRSHQGFIINWPRKFRLLGWLIEIENNGQLKPHIHEEGWLSGCIYINVPPKETPQGANLVISVDTDEYNLNGRNSSRKIIDVATGDLCLFPSSLLHYTIPFCSSEKRVVLGFYVVPN